MTLKLAIVDALAYAVVICIAPVVFVVAGVMRVWAWMTERI